MQLKKSITLISTVHQEVGKCNSEELLKIIECINPEIIFLEAVEEEYSESDKMRFINFGILQKNRLELETIQRYSQKCNFEYVPVLNVNLAKEVEEKIKIAVENQEYKKLIENYISLESEGGFEFLNSEISCSLQEEMRQLENHIIEDEVFHQKVNLFIDEYENSMLSKINSFCKEASFTSAIFMCGAAHRKSIIEKIKSAKTKLNWALFNDKL